jgi:uncharacterized protein (TIGR03382 family)
LDLRGRAAAVAFAVLLAQGCGTTSSPQDSLGRATQPIVGGTVDYGDPAVFILYLQYFDGLDGGGNLLGTGICSGTLIGPHSILTAAHCVDPRPSSGIAPANTASMTIGDVSDVYNVQLAQPSDRFTATRFDYGPSWNPGASSGDVGLVLLQGAPDASFIPYNTADISAAGSLPIRAIGFGRDGGGGSSGVRQQVALTAFNIQSDAFELGDGTSKGTCLGDSGGPSLHSFPDGVERVTGVHSHGNPDCLDGFDTRVDTYQAWIQSWLQQHDPLPCGPDGICTAGCVPPDPDCVPVGNACTSPSQCSSRICLSDPSQPNSYCSQTCSSPSACPANLFCDGGVCFITAGSGINPGQPCTPGGTPCATGSICTGPPGGGTSCLAPCTSAADCPAAWSCVPGSHGNYCLASPPAPDGGGGGVVSGKGCSAMGGGPAALAWILSALAWPRPRRRSA